MIYKKSGIKFQMAIYANIPELFVCIHLSQYSVNCDVSYFVNEIQCAKMIQQFYTTCFTSTYIYLHILYIYMYEIP